MLHTTYYSKQHQSRQLVINTVLPSCHNNKTINIALTFNISSQINETHNVATMMGARGERLQLEIKRQLSILSILILLTVFIIAHSLYHLLSEVNKLS